MKNYFSMQMVCIFVFVVLALSSCSFKVGEGLISFDQTLLLQFAIIIATLYILNVLLFQPLLSLLDRREKLTRGTVEEARELTEKADKIIEDYNNKLNDARVEALVEKEVAADVCMNDSTCSR